MTKPIPLLKPYKCPRCGVLVVRLWAESTHDEAWRRITIDECEWGETEVVPHQCKRKKANP